MKFMKCIDIFEIKGYEINTDLDILILDIHKKKSGLKINKIDVLDKKNMKKHRDIVNILKKDGIESLPLIKVDGKIIDQEKLMQKLV